MAFYPATPFVPQFFTDAGVPLSGGTITAYIAGSSTPTPMYLDGNGTSAGTSIDLNARGEPEVSNNTISIWLDSSIEYKFVLADENAINKWTIDDISNPLFQFGDTSNIVLGDALIGVKRTSTGAVATTLHNWIEGNAISVFDFMTTAQIADVKAGTELLDVTTAMQAAHNTGKLVFYPAGRYKFTSITLTDGGIRGEGQAQTFLSSSNTTTDSITFNGAGQATYNGNSKGPLFESITLMCSGTPTGGALLRINPSSGEISFAQFKNINFYNSWVGLRFDAASHWTMQGCHFINYSDRGCMVRNSNHVDSGDSVITGCTFNNGITQSGLGAALWQESSGGLKIVGCKFLGGAYHYYMSAAGTANAADLLIMGCSLENASANSMIFVRSSGTINWGAIEIVGNQFGGNTIDIQILNNPAFISDVLIAGNSFSQLGAAGIGITINYIDDFAILSNKFSGNAGTSNGISVGSSATTGRINGNTFKNVATPISNSSTTTFVDGLQAGTANVTTSTVYGSLYTGNGSVTFGTPYVQAPQVDISVSNGSAGGLSVLRAVPSTTGFSYTVVGSTNGGSVAINWSAQGPM